AQPVADLVTSTTVAVPVSVGILGWKFALIAGTCHRTRIRSDLLDRADPDAICLAQGTIDGSGFRDPHFGAADQQRNIGRVSITVADETRGIFGRIHRRLEDKTIRRGITQRIDGLDMDTAASLAAGQTQQPGVGHVPVAIDDLELTSFDQKSKVSS